MKFRIVKILSVLLLIGCGSIVELATIEKAPYEYFGEMKLGVPQYSNQKTIIPFSISGGENRLDSAITLAKITAKEKDGKITVSFSKSVDSGAIQKFELVLKNLRQGNYGVFYLNPDGSEKFIQPVVFK
jgi:hypothetical protein